MGGITKKELDDMRMRETKALDMMQNTSIVYHPETILEMQILVIVAAYLTTNWWKPKKNYGSLSESNSADTLLAILLVEHVISYIFCYYRKWEIDHQDKLNLSSWGNEYGPKEYCLRIFEMILDILIFAFIALTLNGLTEAQLHNNPLVHYWVIVDIFIMVLTLPYTIVSKWLMRNNEIGKNIYTLFKVQKDKLKERRAQCTKEQEKWKKFF